MVSQNKNKKKKFQWQYIYIYIYVSEKNETDVTNHDKTIQIFISEKVVETNQSQLILYLFVNFM